MDHVGMTLTPPLRYRGFLGRFTALSTVVRALASGVSCFRCNEGWQALAVPVVVWRSVCDKCLK